MCKKSSDWTDLDLFLALAQLELYGGFEKEMWITLFHWAELKELV